jgi:hypothetical protein
MLSGVNLKPHKVQAYLIGRSSPYSLYREDIVTFEDDHGAHDQKDAEGFIRLNALRLKLAGRARPEVREELIRHIGNTFTHLRICTIFYDRQAL